MQYLGQISKFLGRLLLENLSITVRFFNYFFCFFYGNYLRKAYLNAALMFFLSSWLNKFLEMYEDLLDDRDYDDYKIEMDAFNDAVMEIEFDADNIKMYEKIMRRISKIRNLRSIGFSNLLIDKFYL
jgi:hypothetical protein